MNSREFAAQDTVVTLEKEGASPLDSVAMVAQLLDELAAAPAPMGVSEIARALNQSKARIHRNLVSLKLR